MQEEKTFQNSHTFPGKAEYLQEISLQETPETFNWSLPALYKQDVHGNLRFWQVGFDGTEYLQMSHGIEDGEIRTDCSKIELNTSGRNLTQQALLEAQHRYQYKLNHGYSPLEQQNNVRRLNPMLANKYNVKQKMVFPVYTNPKIDGIRMLVCLEHGNLIKYSRGGITRVNLLHLDNMLRFLLEKLPPGSTLDGEIYHYGLNYNTIESLAQSGWQVGKEHLMKENSTILDYWIFDIHFANDPQAIFEKRWNILENTFENYSAYLPQLYLTPNNLAATHEEIAFHHEHYVKSEYEGTMIRKINVPYKEGRSSNLLKYKDYDTDEAKVVDVEGGTGTHEGVAYLWIQDRYNNKLRVNMKESMSIKRKWLKEPELVVGKIVTFKYQGYQKDSKIPRFPVGLHFKHNL
jgi:hypothetical protein